MKKLMMTLFILLTIQKVAASSSVPLVLVNVSVIGSSLVTATYSCDNPKTLNQCSQQIPIGSTKTLYVLYGSTVHLNINSRIIQKKFTFDHITEMTNIGCKEYLWKENCAKA